MSAPHDCSTLAPSLSVPSSSAPSLFAYARDLRRAEPGAPPPEGGHPLPRTAYPARTRRAGRTHREVRTAVTDVLDALFADPDAGRVAAEAHRGFAAAGIRARTVFAVAAALPPPDEPQDRARVRTLGRLLTREGTTAVAVSAGLGLLARLGEAEDLPYLRALCFLQGLDRQVVATLTPLDPGAAAFARLIHRARWAEMRALVEALASGDGEAVRDRLLDVPAGPGGLGPELARSVAEAVGLAALLRRDPDCPGLVAQAFRLLVRMSGRRNYVAEILRYEEAVDVYETVAAHAHRLPRDLDHRAALVTLALDLHSGAGHLLAWPPGRREAVLDTLLAVVGETAEKPADPVGRRRADWIRRTTRQLRTAPGGEPSRTPRLRIEVAVGDPAEPEVFETRFLVDGRPLVPEAFDPGPGDPPERLLDRGMLRAASEPREVRLAEAWCTEGCCGALYVTVRREDAQVVWDGWRRPGMPGRLAELPAYRFGAAAYDAEVARAENDRSGSGSGGRT
ncbi:hypothetical protein ACWFR1_01230 [Streptomyces sp. NPDC055103]